MGDRLNEENCGLGDADSDWSCSGRGCISRREAVNTYTATTATAIRLESARSITMNTAAEHPDRLAVITFGLACNHLLARAGCRMRPRCDSSVLKFERRPRLLELFDPRLGDARAVH